MLTDGVRTGRVVCWTAGGAAELFDERVSWTTYTAAPISATAKTASRTVPVRPTDRIVESHSWRWTFPRGAPRAARVGLGETSRFVCRKTLT
jgi:hypothetical protein